MLTNAHLRHAVVPAVNLSRARRFYCETLGLREGRRTSDGGIHFRTADGTDIELLPEGAPDSEQTALTFEVGDVEGEVADLEHRGVMFEDFDRDDRRTEHHVAHRGSEKAAWFKDPEGNIVCLHQKS